MNRTNPKKRTYDLSASSRAYNNRIRREAYEATMARARQPRLTYPMPSLNRVLPGQLAARGAEVKALDVPSANYNVTSTAVITPLNLVQTGSTFCNRIGRRIEMKSIRVNGQLDFITTNTQTTYSYARIMIVYDRQTNGAIPSIADILQSTNQSTTNSTNSLSGLNLNNRDRFVVVRDQRITLPPVTFATGVATFQSQTDAVEPTFNIDMYSKLKGLLTQYKADSNPAVIGDISSGGLYLVTFGQLALGLTGYQATLECRLRFLDN